HPHSIQGGTRPLAHGVVEPADLGVFVPSATRYADKVPFDVLQRIAARGLPVLVVWNHLPRGGDDQAVVLRDLRRVLEGTRLRGLDDARIEIVGIAEGQLAALTEGLDPGAAAPVIARIDELAADRGRRLALARRALEGALAGLTTLVETVATDVEREGAEGEAVRGIATHAYEAELAALIDELRGGTFLRTEVLRHWESFVGADQITRFFSRGLGRFRGTIVAAVRG